VSKRLLSYEDGVAKYWHEDGEGNWAVEIVQDTTDLLDMNLEAQNHHDPRWSDGSTRMVARIPPVVAQIWRNLYGIDCNSRDPDMQRKVDKLLNDSEWYKLRTDRSVL
jgi:hypothetical protein